MCGEVRFSARGEFLSVDRYNYTDPIETELLILQISMHYVDYNLQNITLHEKS